MGEKMYLFAVLHKCPSACNIYVFSKYRDAKEQKSEILAYYSELDGVDYRHVDDLHNKHPSVMIFTQQVELGAKPGFIPAVGDSESE